MNILLRFFLLIILLIIPVSSASNLLSPAYGSIELNHDAIRPTLSDDFLLNTRKKYENFKGKFVEINGVFTLSIGDNSPEDWFAFFRFVGGTLSFQEVGSIALVNEDQIILRNNIFIIYKTRDSPRVMHLELISDSDQYKRIVISSASRTITLDDDNVLIDHTGSGSTTFTLPQTSAEPLIAPGYKTSVYNNGNSPIQIETQGSETLEGLSQVNKGEFADLIKMTSDTWLAK